MGTLAELLEDSTAVVLGRPVHYRDNEGEYRRPPDPGLDDSTAVTELKIAEVLAGRLAVDTEIILLPSGVGGPEPKAEHLRRLNAELPEGDSVWFVHTMQGEPPVPGSGTPQTTDPRVHRMAHPYAVFCQGARTVASVRPSNEGDRGFVTELEAYPTMSGLVSFLRTVTVP